VVINVDATNDWVAFIDSGLETLEVGFDFKVIESTQREVDSVVFYNK
jgi:hypothetical protein